MIAIVIGVMFTIGMLFLCALFALLHIASIADDQMEQWAREQKEKSQGGDQR